MSHRSTIIAIALALFVCAAAPLSAQRRRAVLHPVTPPPTDLTYAEGGYADRTSVTQGGTIDFHIASSISKVDVQIVNRAAPATVVATIPSVFTYARDCTGLYAAGCGWDVSTTLQIPLSWPSGIYAAKFPTSKGSRYIPFVVKAANPGSTSPILVISGTNTHQAYNSFGGKSVYPSGSPLRSFKVSFNRPYDDNSGLARIPTWDEPFLNWLTSQGRKVEYAADNDLEDPAFLARYREVVLVGHHEYWTLAMRHGIETFSAAGGHLAIFAGNTMWWQARYEDNGRTLVVYKDAAPDPFTTTNPSETTVNWYDSPVYNPENFILGASFRNAGYANVDVNFAPAPKTNGYTVVDRSSWIFGNVIPAAGQVFGNASTGIEVDGALYNCTQNGLIPDTSDGTPANFHIVAITPATYGHGTLGYYINSAGGAVFNAGTRDWVLGLAGDPFVQKITATVLDRFATGQPFVYDPPDTTYRLRELFNCPADTVTFPGWHGTFSGTSLTSSCAYEGPQGVQLAGTSSIGIYRNFTPNGQALKHVDVRFYVNADTFNRGKDVTMTTVTLSTRLTPTASRDLLQFQIVGTSTGKAAHLVQLRADAPGAEGSTADVPLSSGWNSIQIVWSSPGTISLQVNNAAPVVIQNAHADQGLNELVLNYRPAPIGTDSVCVDAIGLGTAPLPDVPAVRF